MEPALDYTTEPELVLHRKQSLPSFITSVNGASGRPNINLGSRHHDMTLLLTVTTVAYIPCPEFCQCSSLYLTFNIHVLTN
jgi:hypothetical protein